MAVRQSPRGSDVGARSGVSQRTLSSKRAGWWSGAVRAHERDLVDLYVEDEVDAARLRSRIHASTRNGARLPTAEPELEHP